MLIGKINTSIWFCCMKKKKKSLMEDKSNNEVQRPHAHSLEPQKAHLTGELSCAVKLRLYGVSFGL